MSIKTRVRIYSDRERIKLTGRYKYVKINGECKMQFEYILYYTRDIPEQIVTRRKFFFFYTTETRPAQVATRYWAYDEHIDVYVTRIEESPIFECSE